MGNALGGAMRPSLSAPVLSSEERARLACIKAAKVVESRQDEPPARVHNPRLSKVPTRAEIRAEQARESQLRAMSAAFGEDVATRVLSGEQERARRSTVSDETQFLAEMNRQEDEELRMAMEAALQGRTSPAPQAAASPEKPMGAYELRLLRRCASALPACTRCICETSAVL